MEAEAVEWIDESARRRFAAWARKEWAGASMPEGKGRATADAVLDGLREGRMPEQRVGAATWLLEGEGPEGWEAICEQGQVRPSRLAQVVEQMLGPKAGETARRWAGRWEDETGEVTPWGGNGETTWADTAWMVNGAVKPGDEAQYGCHTRGGRKLMVDKDEQARREAEAIAGNVKLPEVVVEAASEGRLHVVLGAGASMAAGLPGYAALAREIGAVGANTADGEVGRALVEARLKTPDLNQRLARAIEDAERQASYRPSAVQEEAVRLAKECDLDGLYTTNWDSLLERAWEGGRALDEGRPREPWEGHEGEGPGVRLLHGSTRAPNAMLATERDLEGWYASEAGRRAIEVLSGGAAVVLTVGYRWADQAMVKTIGARQRARHGLRTQVYAISDLEGMDPDAGYEGGIQPIRYPEGKHAVVPHILGRLRKAALQRPELEAKASMEEMAKRGAKAATRGDWSRLGEAAGKDGPGALVHFTQAANPDDWMDEGTMRAGLAKALAGGGETPRCVAGVADTRRNVESGGAGGGIGCGAGRRRGRDGGGCKAAAGAGEGQRASREEGSRAGAVAAGNGRAQGQGEPAAAHVAMP